MRAFVLSAALGVAFTARAQTNPAPAGDTAPTAVSILNELHAADLTEIQEGKMAEEKATSSKTKAFGRMLVKDHTAADEMVKKEAKRLDITLSDTIPAAQQSEIDDLKSSTDFDSAFARDEAAGHAKVIADAEAAKKAVNDKGVDRLISKVLPKLHKHEKEAEKLEKSSTKTS